VWIWIALSAVLLLLIFLARPLGGQGDNTRADGGDATTGATQQAP
jgi:hypothetical protein